MNILMTLMGLEIGGAETHVVELAKELVRRGHTVSVASNGGVFVKELESVGIKHYNLPLHSKKISNVIKSYNGLKKIIKNGKFDLVHAHARIPGFICGLLHKKLRFRFITTTHWVFKTGFLLNLMTNWGERTIAVSEDIKKYLIENYQLPKEHITVTINGIDTNKFSPHTTPDGVDKEFDMGENKTRIVYVSRMDTDRSAVAFNLLELAPKLYERYPNIEIIIVGGGNDYERLIASVKKTNEQIGKRVAIATGGRTDINKFVATSDMFIGVSRAALEAMAAEKPVIIAGNEGYIGTFEEDKLDISVKTNFCCRGCEMPDNEKLYNDIIKILDLTQEERIKMGQYNRQTILSRYSVIKMAEDCEKAYADLLSFSPFRPNDVLISGYYGYKNIGDDSLLEAIVKNLQNNKGDVKITVLSAKPKETARIYGIKSINRFDLIRICKAMKTTKLLISGGGSLMQDVTSTKSLHYYLTIINLAIKKGMRVMVYANGIGPINIPKNRKHCAKILNKVDLITLRDENSKKELELLGINIPEATVTADPAFSLNPSDEKRIKQIFVDEKLDLSKKIFIVSVRDWKSCSNEFEDTIAEFCDYVSLKYSMCPLFVPMQRSVDSPVCRRILSKITTEGEMLKNSYNAKDLLGIIKKSEFSLGMRLHILIYSLSMGIPVIGLSYDPKIDAILSIFGQKCDYDINTLSLEKLKKTVDEIIADKENISESIKQTALLMREKTDGDAKKAIAILR